jgi:hypothetical protein
VDTDDLVSLAVALGVSPVTLLMPDTAEATERVTLTETQKCDAARMWAWLGGSASIEPGVNSIEYLLSDVIPSWRKEQLLDNLREVSALSTKSESETT